ncbi:unnamed protein product [Prunus armeniaca]
MQEILNFGMFKELQGICRDGNNTRRAGDPTLTGGVFGRKSGPGTGIPEFAKSPTGGGPGMGLSSSSPNPAQ